MKKIRLALVGTGRWGKNIIKTIARLAGCELAYTATKDWQTLLKKEDIDAVLIATPPSTHAEIALPFIQRRLPVFIEKPMTDNLTDAQKIEAAARTSDSSVFVGHLHLYNPAYRKTKELINDIGALLFMVSRGHNQGPYRESYSAMWDWAPHDVSMMLDILGEMPTVVSAWAVSPSRPGTTLWDFAQIKLEFSGGRTGFITSSWLIPPKCKQFTVVGEKKSIVYEDTLPNKKVAVYDNMEVSYPAYEPDLALTVELEAFIRTVTKKEKPLSGLEEGLAVIRILDAAERSIARGGVSQTVTV